MDSVLTTPLEQFLTLEQMVVTFCRNLIILVLTPILTISVLECATYCYRVLVQRTQQIVDAHVPQFITVKGARVPLRTSFNQFQTVQTAE